MNLKVSGRGLGDLHVTCLLDRAGDGIQWDTSPGPGPLQVVIEWSIPGLQALQCRCHQVPAYLQIINKHPSLPPSTIPGLQQVLFCIKTIPGALQPLEQTEITSQNVNERSKLKVKFICGIYANLKQIMSIKHLYEQSRIEKPLMSHSWRPHRPSVLSIWAWATCILWNFDPPPRPQATAPCKA